MVFILSFIQKVYLKDLFFGKDLYKYSITLPTRFCGVILPLSPSEMTMIYKIMIYYTYYFIYLFLQ